LGGGGIYKEAYKDLINAGSMKQPARKCKWWLCWVRNIYNTYELNVKFIL